MEYSELEKILYDANDVWQKMTKEDLENEDFSDNSYVHNWRQYVSKIEKINWQNFDPSVRLAIFVKCEKIANSEYWD